MDRIWQWAWDRYGARYSWVIYAVTVPVMLSIYLVYSFVVVAYEEADDYGYAAVVTLAAVPLLVYAMVLPGMGRIRVAEQWSAGDVVDPARALEATYTYARTTVPRVVVSGTVWAALLTVIIAALAGASWARLVQYAIVGAAFGMAVQLIAVHSFLEGALRPARLAMAGGTEVGDTLPRSLPTFAAWSKISVLAAAFGFAQSGAFLAGAFSWASSAPIVCSAIAFTLTLFWAVPITIGFAFSPSLRPIRDLAAGTERVAAGDYTQRLPVVQDDDLGALAASFNRMQAGLAERQRLQAAFGTYVDPMLATKLLEQGDDVFTGERREVTVMFVDIRDFTPFAESNPAEDVVARLNALFEIVVPAVVDAGGHVNKFLGDGALAVFGAPNDLAIHADAALDAALLIQRLVEKRFDGELRVGIGINTGTVIAGTIGGGSKLEFTLIGDAVNVAARVEQLTKTTGDTVLVTEQTADALASRPTDLVDRGSHALKGKSAPVQIFGLEIEDSRRLNA
ncbi:adenylate/guanylate cyclase domain-containing protein [Mycobacterium sp. 1274761.0]|uniref:adenylate/guanylate cyclase domain-containing protein n=1 Tax=Mycobacterium sp. 1274761.0 TaxID=1834077 RepID=UPI0007FE2CAD|nr:adenylate/guanylate cyclase domain-containing protein [Mycobacterium sp. 1274761.0]OBK74057.1 cyclase [Mycobacterium sp. 1274761.0]